MKATTQQAIQAYRNKKAQEAADAKEIAKHGKVLPAPDMLALLGVK